MSIISGILIGGPVLSIIHNLNQVQETTKCVGNLVQSHSHDLKDVYTGAYRDMANRIEESVKVWRKMGDEIDKVIVPVKRAFSTVEDSIRSFEKSIKSVMNDCAREINKVSK
jgi:hypothetical protein